MEEEEEEEDGRGGREDGRNIVEWVAGEGERRWQNGRHEVEERRGGRGGGGGRQEWQGRGRGVAGGRRRREIALCSVTHQLVVVDEAENSGSNLQDDEDQHNEGILRCVCACVRACVCVRVRVCVHVY